LLLQQYPQAIFVQDIEMHMPLTARLTRSPSSSPKKVQAMIKYSDRNAVRHILGEKRGYSDVGVMEEVFSYFIQQHISS
jgi:hypothetical protein